jgi:hypothetical protein
MSVEEKWSSLSILIRLPGEQGNFSILLYQVGYPAGKDS